MPSVQLGIIGATFQSCSYNGFRGAGGRAVAPRNLEVQLTLFKPGGQIMPPNYCPPPRFERDTFKQMFSISTIFCQFLCLSWIYFLGVSNQMMPHQRNYFIEKKLSQPKFHSFCRPCKDRNQLSRRPPANDRRL